MGFTKEQDEYYSKAASKLIRKQIFRLMKNIPVVELQQIDSENPDVVRTQKILEEYLSDSEYVEYSIWAWLLMKITESESIK